MAGTGIVVSCHRCRMFGRLGDRVMYLVPLTVAPGGPRGNEGTDVLNIRADCYRIVTCRNTVYIVDYDIYMRTCNVD